jgi:hypothetical protein
LSRTSGNCEVQSSRRRLASEGQRPTLSGLVSVRLYVASSG